jgi:membrane protease YdiL (CAAX protease family)
MTDRFGINWMDQLHEVMSNPGGSKGTRDKDCVATGASDPREKCGGRMRLCATMSNASSFSCSLVITRSHTAATRSVGSERAIWIFIAIAYAQSVALSLVIGLTGGYRSPWIAFGYVSMVIPAISALLANAIVKDGRWAIAWDRLPLRYIPCALFLMPLVLHAAMLPAAAALGTLHWQDWLTESRDGLYHTPETLGWGVLTRSGLIARMAVNAIVGVMIVSILALFEEIGWRGWLLPRLIERHGARRAVAICSAVWAVWHVPYMLAGIQHLEGVPLRWVVLVVPAGIFGSGLVIGWLWLRTGSIWIAAIAHGALNHWGQYAFKFVAGEGQPLDALVLASGEVALIIVGLILLCWRVRRD